MKPKTSFSISFVIRKDRVDTDGTVPILMRITVNGKRVNISTGRRVALSKWQNGKAIGNSTASRNVNKALDTFRVRAYEIQRDMIDHHELVTAEAIKNKFTGVHNSTKTVFEVFDYHNQQIKERIGVDYSQNTYKRFLTAKKHTEHFMLHQYKRNDMYLHELKHEFITGMEHHLKTVHNCNHNSTLKYIKNFRKVINMAIKNDWLDKDPFRNYNEKVIPVERDFLTNEEIETLASKELHPRLDPVRDIFLFCCLTGLAYAEVAKLSNNHIQVDNNGQKWISIKRTKTDNMSTIPILKSTEVILEKYKDHPDCKNKGVLLPVRSNQKMNAYLKEIATICGITKPLTTHIARHTFATTITLGNNVSIESVSGMLGHKSIRTTQHYAKITQEKIGKEMKSVNDQVNLNYKKD